MYSLVPTISVIVLSSIMLYYLWFSVIVDECHDIKYILRVCLCHTLISPSSLHMNSGLWVPNYLVFSPAFNSPLSSTYILRLIFYFPNFVPIIRITWEAGHNSVSFYVMNLGF